MIPTKPFGQTGHESTRTLFGAAALKSPDRSKADRALEILLKYGVNHIDLAAGYGHAEEHVGRWMRRHRRSFFLATKTGGRTYREAREELYRSLGRLQLTQIDLYQLHCLVEPGQWRKAFSQQGALEAIIEAKEEGLIRFVGVTGHGLSAPAMHLRSLEQYPFDAVLVPYNYMLIRNPQYAATFEALAAECRTRGIALQTIKSIAQGSWPPVPRSHDTWYVPLSEQEDIDLAVHWVLGDERVFVNTAADVDLLEKVLDAATRFQARPSADAMEGLRRRRELTPLFL
jgi:predicted aldo/keto reductase-like oxidoreductase